jgi:hypothetical protein
MEIEWREPPATDKYEIKPWITALATRPGEWAIHPHEWPTQSSVGGMLDQVRKTAGRLGLSIEATTRSENGKGRLYGRVLAPEPEPEAEA